MIKLVGILMILFGSSAVGILYGEIIKKRLEQLKDIYKSLMLIENEISYLYTPLPEVFNNISQKCNEPLKGIYSMMSSLLVNNKVDEINDAYELSMKENKDKLYLSEEDKLIINEFMKNIGQCDLGGEKGIIEYTKENLNRVIKEIEESQPKKLKLSRSLGFSIGAILAILLI